MTRPFLTADCVTKSFRGRRILTSATLRAVPGQVRAMFGRNGAGKSTLVKIAVGWIAADSGAVRVNDDIFLRPTLPVLARRGVFYLPDHDILSESMSLGRQLALFQRRYGRQSVEEAARAARVDHLLLRRPGQLSGGELRRAEIALAITRGPSCLIADEPFRGIAPVDHDFLIELFRGFASNGCAVVLTGHDVAPLLAAADHVSWCTSGTTHELGTPADARAHFAFGRDYLGPQSR